MGFFVDFFFLNNLESFDLEPGIFVGNLKKKQKLKKCQKNNEKFSKMKKDRIAWRS